MRKTVSITISGQLFHVEEAAYRKLDEYLDAIRYHFSTYEDRDEIVSDIEGRVAEHFAEKLTKTRNVVSEKDVDDLIAHMGTVKDFEDFAGETPTHEASTSAGERAFNPPKRLYRDADNQMIAGVAAGIANYFGIDPTIMRLLFAASLLFGGAGLIIYIVLWVVMPEAKTTSEKMEMRGQPLTLKKIEASIRENIPAAKERIKPGTITRIIQFPFTLLRQLLRFIGRILRITIPMIGRVAGFVIAAGALIALFMLTFAAIMFASGAWDPYMDVPLRDLAGSLVYYMLLASGYLGILIPGILILFIGVSLLLLRSVFRFPIVISLLALWAVSIMLGAVTLGKEGPLLIRKIDQYEEAFTKAVSKNIETGEFRSINVVGKYDIRVRSGSGYGVTVTSPAHLTKEVNVEVRDGVLVIGRTYYNRFCIICLRNTPVVEVTLDGASLDNVELYEGASIEMDGVDLMGGSVVSNGGSSVTIRNGSMPDILLLEATRGSRIDIETTKPIGSLTLGAIAGSQIAYRGEAKQTDIEVSAGSTVNLVGSGTTLKASVVAGSHLEALEFAVREARVEVSAGGHALVNVADRLTGFARAGGEIDYTGSPQLDVENDPSGRVEPLEENFSSDRLR